MKLFENFLGKWVSPWGAILAVVIGLAINLSIGVGLNLPDPASLWPWFWISSFWAILAIGVLVYKPVFQERKWSNSDWNCYFFAVLILSASSSGGYFSSPLPLMEPKFGVNEFLGGMCCWGGPQIYRVISLKLKDKRLRDYRQYENTELDLWLGGLYGVLPFALSLPFSLENMNIFDAMLLFFSDGEVGPWLTFLTILCAWVLAWPVVRYFAKQQKIEREQQAARKRQKEEKEAQAAAHRLALQRENEERELNRQRATQSILNNFRDAVNSVGELPKLHSQITEAFGDAKIHFSNSAFTPFWGSVELAYRLLGNYDGQIDRITRALDNHPVLVANLKGLGGNPGPYLKVPIKLDKVALDKLKTNIKTMADQLDAVSYQAQRNPTFAMIWEQRRTTSVISTGFSSVSASIKSMGEKINNGFLRLESAVYSSGEQTSQAAISAERATRALNQSISSAAYHNSKQNEASLKELEEMRRISEKIHHEIIHQR